MFIINPAMSWEKLPGSITLNTPVIINRRVVSITSQNQRKGLYGSHKNISGKIVSSSNLSSIGFIRRSLIDQSK